MNTNVNYRVSVLAGNGAPLYLETCKNPTDAAMIARNMLTRYEEKAFAAIVEKLSDAPCLELHLAIGSFAAIAEYGWDLIADGRGWKVK